MTTIISGTNRHNSRTSIVANAYAALLEAAGEEAKVLDLSRLDFSYFSEDMYTAEGISPKLAALQDEFILAADKLVFCIPEYNGSFPGIIKTFIDAISVREYSRNFKGKVIGMVGIASGRSGNIRGMDHLSTSLGYMGGWILPNKLPVSSVQGLLDDNDKLVDTATIAALTLHAKELIAA